ncbi:hypothetical protein QUC26_00065 [Pseudomonas asiatica]|uniref:hypothetical protein n=1 Tax=Pseudomonas asiatica TaxID=2219225 RepID=UPI0025A00C65|nr:hypothetical protein [Pseudomonas asiatica]MDM9586381.1 hypothetical protein [Pseudomonas asiatica]WJM53619.1 hypothetical protein QUC26_00065 [Pseudomonas asiatica]
MKHQFILGENQEPLFAVIPYCEYKQVFAPKEHTVQDSEQPKHIPLSIRLPNGGPGAVIDLPRFVDYWCRKGILSMPINQRAKPFHDFESRERFSVEAMVRMCFVPVSYRNTMQVVTEVTDQLVETGLFRLVKLDSAKMVNGEVFIRSKAIVTNEDQRLDIEKYKRAVKCLEIVEEAAVQFVAANEPIMPISDDWWLKNSQL